MDESGEATRQLLTESPDFEPYIREVLEVDSRLDSWDFEDISMDSGVFGELVSRGIVEKTDEGYCVPNRDSVKAALRGDLDTENTSKAPEFRYPSFDLRNLIVLLGLLFFTGALRVYIYPQVFRGGDVVLLSNDPYNYLYLVEQLIRTDFTDLPLGVQGGEPLMIYTLALISSVLGGRDATAYVLAWYPVVSAIITALLIYIFGYKLVDDVRVGLASIAFLAVTPAHSFRTALGYADHHAFDYLWLALTLVSILLLSRVGRGDLGKSRTWILSTLLGFGVAGQVLSWGNGPIIVAPLGVYLVVLTLYSVRCNESPLFSMFPFLTGLTLSTIITGATHIFLGWHIFQVAYSPAILLVSALVVGAIAEIAHRLEISALTLSVVDLLVLLAGLGGFAMFLPKYAGRLWIGIDFLLTDQGAAETQSLLVTDFTVSLFGLLLILSVPVLVWIVWISYRENRPDYLVVGVYAPYFLLLSVLQRRFTGELSLLVAVLMGLGFVYVLGRVDAARPLDLDEKISRIGSGDGYWNALYVVGLFLVVSGLSYPYVHYRAQDLVIEQDTYMAAKWMEGNSEDLGLEYPDNYVFSYWNRNRMLNYFVNGESRSYRYAQRNYVDFISSQDPGDWYEKLKDADRDGYVVLQDIVVGDAPSDSTYSILNRWGSSRGTIEGVGHYRGVYSSADGLPKVFRVVPGAVIRGNSSVSPVEVSTEVRVPGDTFVYHRIVVAERNFSVRVPYPGTYRVGNRTVNVSESEVRGGEEVFVGG